MENVVWLYWLLVAVMGVGVLGAILPAIPGVGLEAIAILIWGFVQGFDKITIPLTVAIVSLLLGAVIDFLAGYYGAKQAGASKWGQIGAAIGLVVGVLGLLPALPFGGPIFGILIGPVLGAMIGEFIYRRDVVIAAKAALGIVVGSLIGRLIQLVLAIVCLAVFLWTTLPQIGV